MSEKRKVSVESMRNAILALSEGGKEFSYGLIYEAMGVEDEANKAIIRSRVGKMIKHGEITRTDRALFAYNFKHQPRQNRTRVAIWRFVRASKPGWTIQECALMTRACYSHSLRYLAWLESEGFVERMGKNEGNATMFRNTAKARQTPETPYPPIKPTDPFAKERAAAATIARLMLCADPYAIKTGRDICGACRVLLARFEKAETDTRTINENEEESHVE